MRIRLVTEMLRFLLSDLNALKIVPKTGKRLNLQPRLCSLGKYYRLRLSNTGKGYLKAVPHVVNKQGEMALKSTVLSCAIA